VVPPVAFDSGVFACGVEPGLRQSMMESTAYLSHPEPGGTGIAADAYAIRRQCETDMRATGPTATRLTNPSGPTMYQLIAG
jgi:hypothetical protein